MADEGSRHLARVVMAAAFLRGLGSARVAPRAQWPAVWRLVEGRSDAPLLGRAAVVDALRTTGLAESAALVADDVRFEAALVAVTEGHVLTVADASYPSRWRAALGQHAPPALWRRGPLPMAGVVGVVGSRRLEREGAEFATAVGREVAGLGMVVVSGGAVGADRQAVSGAVAAGGPAVEILPCGLDVAPTVAGVCQLSASPLDAEFTIGQAMERNALIYAMGSHTVVVWPGLGGGTWSGAVDAVRRRLCGLMVAGRDGDPAVAALVALGGQRLNDPSHVGDGLAIAPPYAQPGLFGGQSVRERLAVPA